MTNEETAKELAREVDTVMSDIGPRIRDRSGPAVPLALAMLAAHHVLHDGGDENDLLAVVRTAWERSVEVHRRSCAGQA